MDVGYQAIISHVVLLLAAGVQYTTVASGAQLGGYTSFPISYLTSESIEPRVLASIGYAF